MLRSIHVVATIVSASLLLAACGGGGGNENKAGGNGESGADTFAGAPADPVGFDDDASASNLSLAPDATQWEIHEVLHDVGLPSDPISIGLEGTKIFGTYYVESGAERQLLNFVLGKTGPVRATSGEYRYEQILDMNKAGHILLSASYRIHPDGNIGSETDARVLVKDGQYIAVPGAQFLNNAGHIAGTSVHVWKTGPFQPSQAFLTVDGVQTQIPLLPGTHWNRATALNSDGHVAGYTRTYVGEGLPEIHRAYVYRDSKVKDLGNLPGTENCMAEDINNRGAIIGRCHDADSGNAGSDQPFVYRDGTMRKLAGVDRLSWGKFAINNLGQIIGAARSHGGEDFPFVHSGGKTVDLNDLPGITGSGARLHEALDISHSGRILAARYDNGKRRYFLLTPSTDTMTAH